MSWLPFYREVVQVLAGYQTRQNELLQLIAQMRADGLPVIATLDEDVEGARIELDEIDPFTFLANFHRSGDATRTQLWSWLRSRWNLSQNVPDDFGGLPSVTTDSLWFLPWKASRADDDVAVLWQLFEQARQSAPGQIDAQLFARALQIHGIGVAKLTSGLFWINAPHYLSLDGTMLKYLQRFQVAPDMAAIKNGDMAAYIQTLSRVHDTLGFDHVQISRDAWQTRNQPNQSVRYWAGGHDFGAEYGGPQIERFIQNNEWQANFLPDNQNRLTNAMRELFSQISVGDEFAIKGANPSYLRVHYLGRVTQILPETWTLKLEPLQRGELYRGKRPVGAGAGNWTQTLIEVRREEDIRLIFHGEEPPPPPKPAFALNQILYGPPGTGKTFHSVARAVEIIDGSISGVREEVVARFEELRAAHRIGFVTFHQSFSYEEFVEGLRPVLDDEESGAARYEVRDGVFKAMALRALAASLSRPTSTSNASIHAISFGALWDIYLERIEGGDHTIVGLDGSLHRVPKVSEKPIHYVKAQQLWRSLSIGETVTPALVRAKFGQHCDYNLIGGVINELRRIENELLNEAPEPLQVLAEAPMDEMELSTEDAREFLNGSPDYDLSGHKSERFVLVIDEINRGNIAKIFGELITLLEDDKRLGATNALRVTLPYSTDTFGVPDNLYLLSTMNTADKSLALLDVALRRRFVFEELRPNFALCENMTPTMQQVLTTLNARLMRVLDREHRIGHALFMDVRDEANWNRTFERKIVPLLQEYFYNDWDSLRSVLGESGTGKIVRELSDMDGLRPRTRFGWWFDADENALAPDFLNVLCANFRIEPQAVVAPDSPNSVSSP